MESAPQNLNAEPTPQDPLRAAWRCTRMNKRFGIPGVDAATPLAIAAPAVLLAKAEPLFDLEDAARGGADMDAVHDMRVASRRLREALRLLAPLYPAKAHRRWYRSVRRITRALGPVRDSDVFIDAFSHLAADLGEGGRRATAFLVGYRTGQRVHELERLNAELARLDLDRSRADFAAFAAALAPTVDSHRTLASFAHAAVAERAAVVFGAQPAALDASNVTAQHALRIDYKHLRYAVEAFAPCYNDAFDALHATLTSFQDALGDLHDAHVFLDMVRDPARTVAAARAGVSAEDLGEVAIVLDMKAEREFQRFVGLAEKHPAEVLLARLLLPLASAPPIVPDAPEGPPVDEPAEPAGHDEPAHLGESGDDSSLREAGGPTGTVDTEAPVVPPVTVGDEPWEEDWAETEARASRIIP